VFKNVLAQTPQIERVRSVGIPLISTRKMSRERYRAFENKSLVERIRVKSPVAVRK
jgi:hypothetical protein